MHFEESTELRALSLTRHNCTAENLSTFDRF